MLKGSIWTKANGRSHPPSRTKNWAGRFRAGVDEGHMKGPGGELDI